MDFVLGIVKAICDFYVWIAPAFWPAAAVLFIAWTFKEARARRDAQQVTNRTQRQEHIEWKKRYISGQLTSSVPSDADIDLNLRWFVVRRDKKPEQVLVSNRGEACAWNVRVRLAESTARAKWRWLIRPKKSMRFKVGRVPDKSINGVALEIHWDDRELLARKVTFIVPQSELELPKPVVFEEPFKVGTADSSSSIQPAPIVPPMAASQPMVSAADPPMLTPKFSELDKPSLPAPSGSVSFPAARDGGHASTNIADRSIPNRTPGLPAKFMVIMEEGQLLLKNLGPGDASHVYLEPLDDDQDVAGESFWFSIPFAKAEPFSLCNTRPIGVHVITFSVSWDDGFRLKRKAEVSFPPKDI